MEKIKAKRQSIVEFLETDEGLKLVLNIFPIEDELEIKSEEIINSEVEFNQTKVEKFEGEILI